MVLRFRVGQPSREEKEVPSYIIDNYFKIGECYFKVKNYSKAVQMNQKAIEKNPKDSRVPLAQYIIAKSYNILKQDENAITALKGIQQTPDNEILNRVVLAELDLMEWEKKYKEFLVK